MDDFSFNISSDSDQFIFRLTFLRTSSWLRTHMYWDDGVSKTEGKRLRKWIDFMTRGSFVSIDHFNFYSRSEILCRYTTSFGNWVIFNSSVFNDTFQYFISILSLLGLMINFLIDMCYEIVHFCIPKFKI